MAPDDPRHGTEAGNQAHRRDGETPCPPCLEAHRRGNIVRQLHPPKVPALGAQRRIQALQALGYSRAVIARELGYTGPGAMAYLMRSATMRRVTHEKIAAMYDRLCMIVPQGHDAAKARGWAARSGFPPPLAWDDIDNPDETPKADLPGRRDLVAEWEHLRSCGATEAEALAALDVERETVLTAYRRAGRPPAWTQIAPTRPDLAA